MDKIKSKWMFKNNSDSVQDLIVVEDNKKSKDATQAKVELTKTTEVDTSKAGAGENQAT